MAKIDGRLGQWDVDTDTQVRYGDPAEEILEAEAEVTPPTILLGSRGQSRPRRLLIGSVSETIIAQASSNVYMLPPP